MPAADTQRPPLETLVGQYARHLKRLPVSTNTVRLYLHGVESFTKWLASQGKHEYDEVVSEHLAATHAVRDYKRHLLTVRKLAPKTVDAHLTGISSLFSWLGMDRPDVPMCINSRSIQADPKSLSEDELRDVLRAAERRGVRDHALVMLLYASGARVAETVALDVDDVPLSERKGVVLIRHGKGGKPREVPLGDAGAIQLLNRWNRVRVSEYGLPNASGPLFVTTKRDRLSSRSVQHIVAKVGSAAGVDLTPHMLRHTFARTLIDKGVDVSTVSDLLGHSNLNTTMVYTRPRAAHREAAVAALAIDY